MAQSLAHFVSGRRLISKLNTINELLIRKNKACFDLGVQGPDIFYTSFKKDKYGTLQLAGKQMHADKVNRSLEVMQDIALHSKWHKISLLAYIAGYVHHYHIDKNIHPYVEKRMNETGFSHSQIETDIEGAIYKHYTGEKINEHILSGVFNRRISFYTHVAQMLAITLKEVFDRDFTHEDILKSVERLIMFNKVFNNKTVSLLSKFRGLKTPLSAFSKYDNQIDIAEVSKIFNDTNKRAALEIDAMLIALNDTRKKFAIDDTLSFQGLPLF